VPDSDRWNFSAGTSFAVAKAVTLDAAASYIKFKDASIDRTTAAYAGTPVQTPILVNGRLDNSHAVVLALGARLAF
jgi:long-chain fatty acid transport protein